MDPEGGYSGVFMGWSRGFSEGVEEFLKLFSFQYRTFCQGHPELSSYSDMRLCQGRSAVFPVKFSSYSQGPEMAVLVLTLNLRWNGLNFLGLHKIVLEEISLLNLYLAEDSWCKIP